MYLSVILEKLMFQDMNIKSMQCQLVAAAGIKLQTVRVPVTINIKNLKETSCLNRTKYTLSLTSKVGRTIVRTNRPKMVSALFPFELFCWIIG